MSIGNLLTQPSIDTLLALGTLDLLLLLTLALALAGTVAAVLFYSLREPVYISAIPSQPLWRRRSTQRACACCVVALIIFALV